VPSKSQLLYFIDDILLHAMDANDFYAQANGQQQVHAHDLSQQRLSQCCTSQGAADGDGLLDGDRVEERGVDLLFFGQLVFVSGGIVRMNVP
jgi:hypothetical protein